MPRRATLIPVIAALVGLPVGWLLAHAVLWLVGYPNDPSRGPAFTGAFVTAVAAAAIALWAINRWHAGRHR